MSPAISLRKPAESRATEASADLDARVKPSLARLSQLPRTDQRYHRLRNEIVSQAMPLADRLARRFEHRGEPLEDLTQVARLGLVKSVNNFDPERGTGFTRFAVPSILGEIKRHFRDKGWLIRVPRRLQETRLAINKATLDLTQQLEREPTVDDLAAALDIPAEQVRAGLECSGAYDGVSMHTPARRGSDEELVDFFGACDPELETVENRVTLSPLLRQLPQRERRILAMRYARDMTQAQIAEQIDLSQMHVSRLLRQSLDTLRAGLGG